MSKLLKLPFLAAVLVATGAGAHGSEKHDEGHSMKGVVESLSGSKLVLKGSDAKLLNVHVDENTKYDNGGAAGAVGDLVPKTRVVVKGEMMKDGTLHAAEIRYGKPATSKPTTTNQPSPPIRNDQANPDAK